MSRVSIVIPNYNHARFLGQSLGSVRAQGRIPDEVIVIDDGSEDDSLSVIEAESVGLPSFRLVRHAVRQGVIATLNEGLALAQGEYICFLGADDYLAPDFVDASSTLLEQYPEAGFCCACVDLVGSGADGPTHIRPIVLPSTRPGLISAPEFQTMLRSIDNMFLGTVMLYRREILQAIGGFDAHLGSLADGIAARVIAARHGFCFVPRVLGFWRIAESNYSILAATNPETLSILIGAARRVIESDPQALFPKGYGALFERRIRFGGSRLVALDGTLPPTDRARTIGALIMASRPGCALLQAFSRLGALGRLCTLGWLTLRLRPYSLWRLCREPLRRFVVTR
jgi:glycosyltransferase involved in cell wall biosynthesis